MSRKSKVRRIDALDRPPTHSIEDEIYAEIVRLRAVGEGAALGTVIRVRGSSPAREPMKILVREDGSTLGSVGGGCLEEEVKRLAAQVLEEGRPARFSMSLTAEESPDEALICGGEVEVFLEPISAPPLLLFGGGHVSRAVAWLAARTGFRVVVTDDRPAYAHRERFPMAAETIVAYPEEAARSLPLGASSYVLVMTRSHAEDRRILTELARREIQPRYLGMIGSATKVRLTYEALKEAGISPAWLRRIRAPVGLRIGARSADEIAVAIVAEMLALRRGKLEGRWDLGQATFSNPPEP